MDRAKQKLRVLSVMWDVVWDSVPTQAEYVCVEYLLTLSHRQLEKKSVKL